MLENVRKKSPLIHNIINYVTANEWVNIMIGCGTTKGVDADRLQKGKGEYTIEFDHIET